MDSKRWTWPQGLSGPFSHFLKQGLFYRTCDRGESLFSQRWGACYCTEQVLWLKKKIKGHRKSLGGDTVVLNLGFVAVFIQLSVSWKFTELYDKRVNFALCQLSLSFKIEKKKRPNQLDKYLDIYLKLSKRKKEERREGEREGKQSSPYIEQHVLHEGGTWSSSFLWSQCLAPRRPIISTYWANYACSHFLSRQRQVYPLSHTPALRVFEDPLRHHSSSLLWAELNHVPSLYCLSPDIISLSLPTLPLQH